MRKPSQDRLISPVTQQESAEPGLELMFSNQGFMKCAASYLSDVGHVADTLETACPFSVRWDEKIIELL